MLIDFGKDGALALREAFRFTESRAGIRSSGRRAGLAYQGHDHVRVKTENNALEFIGTDSYALAMIKIKLPEQCKDLVIDDLLEMEQVGAYLSDKKNEPISLKYDVDGKYFLIYFDTKKEEKEVIIKSAGKHYFPNYKQVFESNEKEECVVVSSPCREACSVFKTARGGRDSFTSFDKNIPDTIEPLSKMKISVFNRLKPVDQNLELSVKDIWSFYVPKKIKEKNTCVQTSQLKRISSSLNSLGFKNEDLEMRIGASGNSSVFSTYNDRMDVKFIAASFLNVEA